MVIRKVNGKLVAEQPPAYTASGARDFSLPAAATLPLLRPEPLTSDRVYTLAELIDLAQMNNPQTRTAWDSALEAASSVKSARSAYLPTVSATVLGGYQRQGSNSAVSGSLSSQSDMDAHGSVSTASLSWLLFDFGGRDATLAAARNSLEASNIAFNGTHQKIIYDVSRNFFDYTSARSALALTAKARDESAYLLKASTARFAQGLDSAVDLSKAKSMMAEADYQLVDAQGSERDDYNSLIKAVGISPTTKLRIQDVSGRPLPAVLPVPITHLIQDALRRRADVQAGLASLYSARNKIISSEADFLPKIFLSASGSYTTGNINVTSSTNLPGNIGSLSSNNNMNMNSSNVTVLGGASIPIYDGGMREASLESALASADSAASTVIMLQQNAASEIVSASDSLRNNLASYRAAVVSVQASEMAKDSAFASYANGYDSLTSAVDAEKSLQSARMAKEKAHGTALIAAATLAFAAGRLGSSDAVPGGGLPHGPLK